ncbi:MAG: methyl-accepting chemotaxis protein [Pseudolabrys sp.]
MSKQHVNGIEEAIMRINKPTTSNEFEFDGARSLYSTTDMTGRITFANPYFIEVSGFSEEELIGAPHNIVRHPDMPVAAFADLWTTIKAGQPWTAMVKNRRKNGDYYWVQATVTPIIEAGNATGYMSVRTKPTREQIAAADKLYRGENEKPGSLRLRQGRVLRGGVLGRVAEAARLSLGQRVALIHVSLFVLTISVGALAWLPDAWGELKLPIGAALFAAATAAITWSWHELATKVVASLKAAAGVAQAMAGGDLNMAIDVTRTDEIGRLMRAVCQLNTNLRSVIGDIRENFASIQTATGELATGNADLSARTDSQVSSLEETAASMEQLAATVRQNLENTNQARDVASNAMTTAQRGGAIMGEVVATIGEISQSSEKIANIVTIINGIASQTNLLALNAAVEAARAGEAGRGFAVVATEVRSLAQRSAEAAKDIKSLIDSSVEKVAVGTHLSRDAGVIMQEIIAAVSQVSGVVSEIAAASAEQSTGIGQVNDAVTQMDEVTQRNASLVEIAASATSGLEDQGRKLMQALAIFKLGNGRRDTPALPAAMRPSRPAARRAAA